MRGLVALAWIALTSTAQAQDDRAVGLVVQGTQEYLKALETTRYLHRGAMREDVQDFLEAVQRISAVEQRTDEAQRAVKRAFVRDHVGHTLLYV